MWRRYSVADGSSFALKLFQPDWIFSTFLDFMTFIVGLSEFIVTKLLRHSTIYDVIMSDFKEICNFSITTTQIHTQNGRVTYFRLSVKTMDSLSE